MDQQSQLQAIRQHGSSGHINYQGVCTASSAARSTSWRQVTCMHVTPQSMHATNKQKRHYNLCRRCRNSQTNLTFPTDQSKQSGASNRTHRSRSKRQLCLRWAPGQNRPRGQATTRCFLLHVPLFPFYCIFLLTSTQNISIERHWNFFAVRIPQCVCESPTALELSSYPILLWRTSNSGYIGQNYPTVLHAAFELLCPGALRAQ